MILERLKQYIDCKGITVAAFEKSIGMSNASFGKCLKKGGAIGTDKLENILSVYPEISPCWLLTGKGDMLRVDSAQTSSGDNSPNIQGNSNNIHICDNAVMEERIKSLEALLAEKERIIQIYEQISKK